jgi:RNA polymerase sigma-70 factor, ECF subfamily
MPDPFTDLRPLLFTIAYEILGSATEADDVLQESWLRWSDVDVTTVRDPRPYLAQLVTRQSLNALRTRVRRREDYVGPWLPEPLLLDERDPAADAVLAESVSMAMLVVLETLGPDERAVFVLREVFGFEYAEIGEAVGKAPATVRQMAHRAREHVQARRKRFEPVADTAEVTERFLQAAGTGDVEGLMAVLSPDVVWTADGGGKATAARKPVVGAERVAGMLGGMFRYGAHQPGFRTEFVISNSMPAVIVYTAERCEGIYLLEIAGGKITHFYAVRNPEKLVSLATIRPITR